MKVKTTLKPDSWDCVKEASGTKKKEETK